MGPALLRLPRHLDGRSGKNGKGWQTLGGFSAKFSGAYLGHVAPDPPQMLLGFLTNEHCPILEHLESDLKEPHRLDSPESLGI